MQCQKKTKKGGDSIPRSNSNSELETIYTECWNHTRQCINERLWFTNIYAAVLAAILVYMGEMSSRDNFGSVFLLAIFGIILSIIGYLVVIAVSLGYDHYIGDITMILYYWDMMEFYRHPKKPVTFRKVHLWFFEITIVLFSVISLYSLFQVFRENPLWLILIFIVIFVFVKKFYHRKWERYSTECSLFKEALQYDFDRKYRKEWPEYFKDPRKFIGKEKIKAEDIRKKVIDDSTPKTQSNTGQKISGK